MKKENERRRSVRLVTTVRSLFWVFTGLLILSCGRLDARTSPLVLKSIAADDELSHAWINAIKQDFLGFIWIATSDGLYRYDGYEICTYRSVVGDSLTLAGNNIISIYEDQNKVLWIGTTRGLSKYDRDHDRFFHTQFYPKENISDIFEGKDRRLYVGTYEGLFVSDTLKESFQVFYQYSENDEIYDGNQPFIILDSLHLLLNGPQGLVFFRTDRQEFSRAYSFPGIDRWVSVTEILKDYRGTLWIASREEGLFYILPGREPKRFNYPENNELFSTTLSLWQSNDSVLWIGTENHGICRLDLEDFYRGTLKVFQFTSEDPEAGLLNNSIYALFEDSQENIWVGTYAGLNLYNPAYSNFKHVESTLRGDGLINNFVNTFFEEDGKIWVGTEGGVSIFDPENNQFSTLENKERQVSLSSEAVYSIIKTPDNIIWLGTWAGGLNRYNPRTGDIKVFTTRENGLSNNNIFSMVEDKEGILWIGTMGGGLNRYDPSTGNFKAYMHDNLDPESLPNNWVRQVFLDSRDRLWVSTYNSLDILDRRREVFTHFFYNENDSSSISDNGATVIFEDSRQHIWLGTETGLNLYHEADSGFSLYTEKDGLPSNVINAILEDDQGNLWLSTNEGIARFSDAISLPREPEFSVFDLRDGLQGNKFNQRSALKADDGTLYFGGKNGYNSFHPDHIIANSLAPAVRITHFLIFNKTEVFPGEEGFTLDKHITLAEEIRLKYKYRVFTVYFAALNYIVPEKNQYKYMLEGFEEDWNNVGNQHSATYTNLDPGEYILHVNASNNSGIWNNEGVQLRIIIDPPWYRTVWAYGLYSLIILFIILTYRRFVLIRSQLKHELVLQSVEKDKIDQLAKMKTRFFTNISHEFRTPLTLILGPLDSLVSDINLRPAIKQKLSIIQKNARRMLRLINQLLDISEIEADHLKLKVRRGDIMDYLREIASLFRWVAAQRNIDFVINTGSGQPDAWFDSDKIEKISYNLLANAFKYTPEGGTVHIEAAIEPNSELQDQEVLKLVVKDSGIGISKKDQAKIFEHFYRSERMAFSGKSGSGIGLALVQGLVGVYRGKINLESEPEEGTKFTILLPVSRDAFHADEIIEADTGEMPLTLDIYDMEHTTEPALPESHPAANGQREGIILVVEDNEDMRKHICSILDDLYQVLEAPDGRAALEICHEQVLDLVISDVRMPEMDGLELCRTLKYDQKTSHLPILMLTAKARNEDRLEGVQTGADAYITKPFSNKLLRATVNNLLESRKKLKEKYSRSVLVEPTEISITSVDEKFLRKAIEIVEKNIANPDYSVDTFSKDIGMSRSHLHRKFVGLTGHSPSGFIRTLRMKRAALLLTKGQLTVSEILFEVGIKSRSYFTKSFKEQFGLSPTDFVSKSRERGENKLTIEF